MTRSLKTLVSLAALALAVVSQAWTQSKTGEETSPLADRVGSTGFIQLQADSFRQLNAREQALAYWLSQASIAVNPIVYDQYSRFGLRQKRVLELIVAHPEGIDRASYAKTLAFTKLFWANRGNHNETTAQKFLPDFTFDQLRAAGLAALQHGAAGFTSAAFQREIEELKPSLFDPNFEPLITAKSPRGGLDILEASANNFYSGVKLSDLKNFTERYALNSRLAKVNGHLEEQVYRAGTPDHRVPPGLYAEYLAKANSYLAKAAQFAEPAQAKAIRDLITLLSNRRIQGLAAVRRRLGAGQRSRRFHQRLHRGLSRRARRQGHLAELRQYRRQPDGRADAQDRGERAVFRGPRAVGSRNTASRV